MFYIFFQNRINNQLISFKKNHLNPKTKTQRTTPLVVLSSIVHRAENVSALLVVFPIPRITECTIVASPTGRKTMNPVADFIYCSLLFFLPSPNKNLSEFEMVAPGKSVSMRKIYACFLWMFTAIGRARTVLGC